MGVTTVFAASGPAASILGIDLAWSPRNATGIAVGCVEANGVRITETSCVRTDDEIIALAHCLPAPLTIAIDAPTVCPNETGCATASASSKCCLGGTTLGLTLAIAPSSAKPMAAFLAVSALSARMQSELGALEGLPAARHVGVAVMEVFPAPAIAAVSTRPRTHLQEEAGTHVGLVPNGPM